LKIFKGTGPILGVMEIAAECERKAGLWEVRVPQLGDLVFSSRRLDSAAEQIKDLVHENQGPSGAM